MSAALNRSEFVALAFGMSETVNEFLVRARAYFYLVALSGHACPRCAGRLEMIGESRCRCGGCGAVLDPTITFKQCSACGGKPRLRVRRYECGACGADVPSRFVFDGLVFDADYFRQKMAEHRQRKQDLRDRVQEMLAGTRSLPLESHPIALESVPGLLEALNGLTIATSEAFQFEPRSRFDLTAYQRHIEAHIGTIPLAFDEIPALRSDDRLDRVWRFIAVIFLAHEGRVEVVQEGEEIMVMQRETDREGCEVPGDLEEADGVEGLVG